MSRRSSLCALALTLVSLLSACAHRSADLDGGGMLMRNFGGKLVEGRYVSPSAYQHYVLAERLSLAGDRDGATLEFRRAIDFDPASPYLHLRLGDELLHAGRIDETREEVERALQLDPRFAEAYGLLARLRQRMGDAPGAEVALRQGIEVDPACEELHLGLIDLITANPRSDEVRVIAAWRELDKRVPDSARAQEALALFAARRGEVPEAEQRARRALQSRSDETTLRARLLLAQILVRDGRAAEAEVLVDRAAQLVARIEVAPERKRLAVLLVRLNRVLGRQERAQAVVESLRRAQRVPALELSEIELALTDKLDEDSLDRVRKDVSQR